MILSTNIIIFTLFLLPLATAASIPEPGLPRSNVLPRWQTNSNKMRRGNFARYSGFAAPITGCTDLQYIYAPLANTNITHNNSTFNQGSHGTLSAACEGSASPHRAEIDLDACFGIANGDLQFMALGFFTQTARNCTVPFNIDVGNGNVTLDCTFNDDSEKHATIDLNQWIGELGGDGQTKQLMC